MNARAAHTGAPGSLLRLERTLLAGGIAAVTILCWSYLLERSAPAMHAAHGGFSAALVMWVVMVGGMMLPSAAPMLFTYERVSSGIARGHRARTAVFAGAYVMLWCGAAALAAAGQIGLGRSGLLSPAGGSTRPLFSGALLLTAGAYQVSPLKQACLHHCRSPMGFVLTAWRPGVRGALAMGLRHGTTCVLCCWAVMALAFVFGTMDLLWMGAITLFMLAEKTFPLGRQIGLVCGYVFLFCGAIILIGAA